MTQKRKNHWNRTAHWIAAVIGYLAVSMHSTFAQGTPPSAERTPSFSTGRVADIGRWLMLRTPGLDGNNETISILHTADALKSDPDFAGLMIRCREKLSLQVAFAVIRPFPPRAHPRVSISAGSGKASFEASVLPPGGLVTLPDEAEALTRGPWQSANEMSVEIKSNDYKVRGIVSLENLAGAIALLQANCRF
jgi:hypothetical protein